jgi:hypothetical protein
MTFWEIGDEEPEDPRFIAAGPGACGLYHMAGAYCMRQARYRPEHEVPPEWFVSDQWARGWQNGSRLAARLVENGLWFRVPGGYKFDWIRPRNTADAVRAKRKKERDKKACKHVDSPGESAPIPQGTYTGESDAPPRPTRKRSRSAGESRDAS